MVEGQHASVAIVAVFGPQRLQLMADDAVAKLYRRCASSAKFRLAMP